MLAFEQGKLDIERFSSRLDELALTSEWLQQRKETLLAALDDAHAQPPAEPLLDGLRDRVRSAIAIEECGPKKAVVSTFVQDIEVRSRTEIYPTFRVPTAASIDEKVRMLSGSVGATGIEPVTSAM
jgi:hypothetical protein